MSYEDYDLKTPDSRMDFAHYLVGRAESIMRESLARSIGPKDKAMTRWLAEAERLRQSREVETEETEHV